MNTQPPKTTEEQLENILDWQVRLSVREAVLQDATANHKIHITREMIDEAKAEAIKQLKDLLDAERLDELDKQAAVTSGITDPAMCMKLLAERHLMRIQELGAIHQTAKAGRRTT